jgi:homopolymeric O-antigen transport system permease protein
VSSAPFLPVSDIEPRRGLDGLGLRELRHTGNLLWLFIVREFKLRYVQTALGPLWVVVNPLVPALLFTFLFTKVTTIDTGGVPYLAVVSVAMVPWNTVSRTLTRGGGALVGQRQLLTKVYFPRLLVPLSITITFIVDYLVALGIVGVVMLQFDLPVSWHIVVLPALAVWTLGLALAATLLVAAVSVRRRDALSALPIAVQVWLYVSPVVYTLASLSGLTRTLIDFNPMTSLVEAHRWAITGSTALGATAMACGVLMNVVLLAIALAAFRIADRNMADVI